jgi:Insertion element 4 transposase N-terminal
MQLKEFSLFVPNVESGKVLKALETAIPSSAIEQAIADTKSTEERKRALPSHLVVCLIIAMSLWSRVSMRTVLKNLVDGLSEAWIKVGSYWRIPCKSSITEARQRIGSQVITRLFHLLVRQECYSRNPRSFS